MDPRLKNPVTVLIAGPSCSGKSFFLMKLLRHGEQMFEEPPKKIVWCYGVYQDAYNSMLSEFDNLTFVEGLPENINDHFDGIEPGCLVLDDLMFTGAKSEAVAKILTEGSHHRNIAVFLLVQNIFHGGAFMRTISLNSRYIVLMRNNRDKLQVMNLAKQMFPNNTHFLCDAYEDSIKMSKYGYLFIDLNHPESSLRVRTQIFPDELHYVYVMKNT